MLCNHKSNYVCRQLVAAEAKVERVTREGRETRGRARVKRGLRQTQKAPTVGGQSLMNFCSQPGREVVKLVNRAKLTRHQLQLNLTFSIQYIHAHILTYISSVLIIFMLGLYKFLLPLSSTLLLIYF
jgi:hypothetical protein